jgi:hypothetical protein
MEPGIGAHTADVPRAVTARDTFDARAADWLMTLLGKHKHRESVNSQLQALGLKP